MSIGSMINFRVLHGIHGQSSGYVRRVSYSGIVQVMRKSVHSEGGRDASSQVQRWAKQYNSILDFLGLKVRRPCRSGTAWR